MTDIDSITMGIEGLPDDVSDFERTMFLASPERIMMF
jgi:hypothetical protein